MDDPEAMRQMVIAAVNECDDLELLDLIRQILLCETPNGRGNTPAAFLYSTTPKDGAFA